MPGGVAEPQGQVVNGGGQLPRVRGVGQGLAAGKPGQAPGCFLHDMLEVAAEGLVDMEQEDKVLGLLQMGLLAYSRGQIRPAILQNPGMDTFLPAEPRFVHLSCNILILMKNPAMQGPNNELCS